MASRHRRHRRRRKQAAFHPLSTCSNCGERGAHFVPPSLGEPGFFHCKPLFAAMSFNAVCFELYRHGLMRRVAEAMSLPLDLICLDTKRPPGPWINERLRTHPASMIMPLRDERKEALAYVETVSRHHAECVSRAMSALIRSNMVHS